MTGAAMTSVAHRARKPALLTLAAVVVALGTWAVYPRSPSLAGFDPDAMARIDTAMWRDYYEKRYAALFYNLYSVSREQFG